jgi:predicted HD superfamily hydrolase involved in NAD metabolism
MEEYKALIRDRLTKDRYEHSLGVAQTARELAIQYGADGEKAYLAGILHDYAKNLPNQKLLEIAINNSLIVDPAEKENPQLLHGPVGAVLIEKELGIKDKEILNAIRYHTTGRSQMDRLSQILYIADYIEPNRNFPGVDSLRKITYTNLLAGVLAGLNNSIKFVIDNNQLLHILSVEARNWLLLNSGRVGE